MAISLFSHLYTGRQPWLPRLSNDSAKSDYNAQFVCHHLATKAKYSVTNVFGNLLYTEFNSLDMQLPNSNYIRPGIHATDPHSQVSNKETVCPGQGKDPAIFTA